MHRRIDGFTFNVTVGLLVKKGRDATAEKVKQGDITEQKLRDVIVGESFKPKENMKLRGNEQKKKIVLVLMRVRFLKMPQFHIKALEI